MVLNGNKLIEVLPLRDLYNVYQWHDRLTVFVNKGRECVGCGRVGVLLLVTQDKGGRRHVDLYTDDFVLMTVDHIIPKAEARKMGWGKLAIESLDNKQCMCEPCNNKKGCKYIGFVKKETPQRYNGVEVIRQLVFNESVFSRSLEGAT